MTWRIDETALFDRVAHYFRKPTLDEGEREAVRAITRRVAGESEGITPDAVLAAIRDAERRAGERLAALQAGRQPPESEIPELEVALLAALDHFAADEAFTTPVLHLAGTHRRLRDLEASLRAPQPVAARIHGVPPTGPADFTGTELRSPHVRTPPPPPQTPQGRDAGPLIGPALWAQVFRDSHLVAEPEPKMAGLDEFARPTREALVRYLEENREELISKVHLLDFYPVLKAINDSGFDRNIQTRIGQAGIFNWTLWLNRARAGGDNFLARILDGFVAVSLMKKYPWALRKGGQLDLSVHYVPFWYSLHLARDAAAEVKTPAGRNLLRFFEDRIKNLEQKYKIQIGPKPPRLDWKLVSKLPRFKVGIAFLSHEKREALAEAAYNVPDDLPMVRVRSGATLPLTPSPSGRGDEQEREVGAPRPALSTDEAARIRAEVDRWAQGWGTETNLAQDAADRVIDTLLSVAGLGVEIGEGPDRPGNSRLATGRLLIWFVYGCFESLYGIAKGRLKGDPRLDDFTKHLVHASEQLLHTVDWLPKIDRASLEAIATAFIQSKVENRPVVLSSTHESWVDIVTIASLFKDKGLRFSYKTQLLWVPPLNLILLSADMDLTDRVKPTDNPDADGMGRVKSFLQFEKIAENRERDGALSTIFTPGTRSRAAGVGLPKKGTANHAIDTDAIVLAISLFGPSQVMSPSWGRFIGSGAGTDREVHLRATLIDPRTIQPSEGLNPSLARRDRVAKVTHAVFQAQIRSHLTILEDLRSRATPVDAKDEATGKPAEPNGPRIQLNEHLDQYAEAFHFLDRHKDKSFEVWCAKKKVGPEYVKELWAWVTGAELDAVYAREKRRLDPKDGTVRGIWTAPLSSTMYSREERMRLGWAYLWPKMKVLGRLLGHIAPFTENGNVAVAKDDGTWAKVGKRVLNGLGALIRTLGGRRYSIRPQAIAELIPKEARLEPIERETIIAVLTAFVGEHNVRELPAVLAQRIDEVYGAHRETAEAFKAHALEYLQFIVEDTRRTVAVIEQDAPTDNRAVRAAEETVHERFGHVRWHKTPMDEYLFVAVRDFDESEQILGQGLAPAAQTKFDSLVTAERELHEAVQRGRPESQSERDFGAEIFRRREKVRIVFESFSEVAGLGASHETFSSFHLYGRAIPQDLLAHIIITDGHLNRCHLNGEVLAAHRELHASTGAEKKVQEAADRRFETVMRRYLDIPGNARYLQARFLKVWSARDLLLHDPVDFMGTIFSRVYAGRRPAQDSPVERYRHAWQAYTHLVLPGKSDRLSREQEIAIEKAKGDLDKAAMELLDSSQGLSLLDDVHTYLAIERGLLQPVEADGLRSALAAHAHYMKVRRGWAFEEQSRYEALLPAIFDYERWKEAEMGKFVERDATLIFRWALVMMTTARQSVDGHLDREKMIALEDSVFEKAANVFSATQPLLAQELNNLREHLERVADPTKVDEWVATGRNLPNGHKLRLNRAIESLHVAASEAYRAAARAVRLLKGESTDLPPVFSLTATALHLKLSPTTDMDSHRQDGEDFLNGFMGKTVLPCVLQGMWMIQQGLPGENLDPIIFDWAKRASTEFHLIRVDDKRSGIRLPGVHEVADLAHNGGWYIDYSTSLLLSPDGHPYVLIAKTDLGKKMIVGMAQGVGMLAQSLPGDETPQSGVEALIIGAMIGGINKDYARPGSQHVGLFGAITMGVQAEPDPVAILDPTVLLDDKFITAHDLRGLGRQTSVLRGAAAVRGTVAPFSGTVSTHTGGHGAGPKPDKPFIARRREMHATIEEVDPLSLPLGTSLLERGEVRSPFTERHVGGFTTRWMRHRMHTGAQARRLRDHKPPPAPVMPDRPEPPTRPGGRAESPGQRPAGFGELTAGLVRGVPRLDRTGSDGEVVRDEGPERETGRAVEVMIALAGSVGLADQYAAYRQRGGKVSDLLRLADKVKAWLLSQGIQADKVPLIYLALGAFVIRAGDEPKRAYLKIVASHAAANPTAPSAAVPGIPAWAVPGALPAQVIPVPVH